MNPLLIRRRGMMAQGGGGLPYDAKIEYLEGNGNQYITTAFIPTNDELRIVAKAYKNATGDNFLFSMDFTPIFNMDWYANSMYVRNLGSNVTKVCQAGVHTFELSKTQYIQDGTAYSLIRTSSIVNNTNPIVLLASVIGNYKFKGRIYYFQCYYGDELALDFIPVRVGTVGYMYDQVSGQLFGNVGTGDFVLGPDIV